MPQCFVPDLLSTLLPFFVAYVVRFTFCTFSCLQSGLLPRVMSKLITELMVVGEVKGCVQGLWAGWCCMALTSFTCMTMFGRILGHSRVRTGRALGLWAGAYKGYVQRMWEGGGRSS